MSLIDRLNNKDTVLTIYDNGIVTEGTIMSTNMYNIKCDVRGREREIPHFHIMTPDRKVDFCIKLGVAEWFAHGNHIYPPKNDKQLDEIVKLLSLPNEKRGGTNYTAMISTWNESNPHATVDPNLSMPDYSTLTLKDARDMVKYVNKHGGVRFTGNY